MNHISQLTIVRKKVTLSPGYGTLNQGASYKTDDLTSVLAGWPGS